MHGLAETEIADTKKRAGIGSGRRDIPGHRPINKRIGVAGGIDEETFAGEGASKGIRVFIGIGRVRESVELVDTADFRLSFVGDGPASEVDVGPKEEAELCDQSLAGGVGNDIDGVAVGRAAVNMINEGNVGKIGDIEILRLSAEQGLVIDGRPHNIARGIGAVSGPVEEEFILVIGLPEDNRRQQKSNGDCG